MELVKLLEEMHWSADMIRSSCGDSKAWYPMEAIQSCLLSIIVYKETQTIKEIISMLLETDVGDLAKFAYTLIHMNSNIIFKTLPLLRALMFRRLGYKHIDNVDARLRELMELLNLPVRNHKIDVEVEPLLKKVTETPELKELVSQLKRIGKEISDSNIYYRIADVERLLQYRNLRISNQVKVITVIAVYAALNDISTIEKIVDELVDELEDKDKKRLSEPVLVFLLKYLLCRFNKLVYNLKTAYSIVSLIKLPSVENLDDYNTITNKLKYAIDVAKVMLEQMKTEATNIIGAQLEENQLCDVLSLSINYIWVLARILRDNVNHVFS